MELIRSPSSKEKVGEIMMRYISVLLSGIFALFLGGCKTPTVSINEISPQPLVIMHSNDTFSVQPGSHQTASAHQIVPTCRKSNDNEVLITGSLVLANSSSKNAEETFDLRALGFHLESMGDPLSFYWVDPDGTKTRLKQVKSPE